MLTCKQITELVTAYVEGQLRLMDRLRFRMHIGMCSHCKTYVRQLETTRKTLGRLPEPEIPPELEADLMRAFENWKPRQ